MISHLRYGADASLNFELDSDALVAHCDAPRGEPLANLDEAVDRALTEPLEFPSLAQAAVAGDKVVLALAPAVPGAATLIARTVEVLLAAGVSAEDITVLRTIADVEQGVPDPASQIRDNVRQAVQCQTHDPANRKSLSYLAASADGEPIYIHRAIHDADLVIPIDCLRLEDSLGYHGIHSCLFPTFSDEPTAARFRSPAAGEPQRHERLRQQADEVGWLLGVQFTVQVVPAADNQVLHVLAGECQAVLREGRRRCDEAWSCSVPSRASLVVATIEGDASQQTWNNVARALAAASRAVSVNGAVTICCELSQRLGPALMRVAGAEDLHAALGEIAKERPSDTLAAAELVRALERGRVYLLSQLDEELVEDLGVLPVTAEQISKLAARYDSCIVLRNAQYAIARPQTESADATRPSRSNSRPSKSRPPKSRR